MKYFSRSLSLITLCLLGLAGTTLVLCGAGGQEVFNTTAPRNDLRGDLSAEVLFAQSQVIPAVPRSFDRQPRLIGLRKAMLMVRPLSISRAPMTVTAFGVSGEELGSLSLASPEFLPKTAYNFDLPEGGVDFTPKNSFYAVINSSAQLLKLSDPDGAMLGEMLLANDQLEIATADGAWTREIRIPSSTAFDGKLIKVSSRAGYDSVIYYSGKEMKVSRGQSFFLKSVSGRWFLDAELMNNGLRYASDAWSAELPASWVRPGLRLLFRQGLATGEFSRVNVGPPTQLLLHTIDIGLLVPPRDDFKFAKDVEAHREYFQTLPASRLVVSQYEPLHLEEVMLPTGELLSYVDPSVGGWHEGTMRQRIGKELVSHGIDNANYGLNSSAGVGEGSHSFLSAQLVAHNSRGRYANGIQVHGGSGGNGIVTLDDSLGNEFSHEVGHNFGLGHYNGGFNGSVHQSAGNVNSTWGWDADRRIFIPNFEQFRTGVAAAYAGRSQPPFGGRSFGFDAMAGGGPMAALNRFTLYTPSSAAAIQRFLESKVMFDEQSPTGFVRWDDVKARFEPYSNLIFSGASVTAPVNGLTANVLGDSLGRLITEYDRVHVSMWDGNWTSQVPLPRASKANQGRIFTIRHNAGWNSVLLINGSRLTLRRGFQKDYVSDGQRWREAKTEEVLVERKPKDFGVPVVTLVGYYDPLGVLPSYAYPALHGALGYAYPDDSADLRSDDSYLEVETDDGAMIYRLARQRLTPVCMNKFHVNIPESSKPRKYSIVVRGAVVATRTIEPVKRKLEVTVNGDDSLAIDRR